VATALPASTTATAEANAKSVQDPIREERPFLGTVVGKEEAAGSVVGLGRNTRPAYLPIGACCGINQGGQTVTDWARWSLGVGPPSPPTPKLRTGKPAVGTASPMHLRPDLRFRWWRA